MKALEVACLDCGTRVIRTGPTQRYCGNCSRDRDLTRKKLWARKHPKPRERSVRDSANRKRRLKSAAIERSSQNAQSIAWDASDPIDLNWVVRFAVPFSYAASKNHIYSMRSSGHRELRIEANEMKRKIADSLLESIQRMGVKVVHNKVWLDILVQKSNHRGDAVNVLDLVCDAVKRALPVDDRWFCIRRLDWEVVKKNPRLFIGIGQENVEDSQVCSYCGLILPLAAFCKKSDTPLGVGRECRSCRSVKNSKPGRLEVRIERLTDEPPEQRLLGLSGFKAIGGGE